MEQEYSLWLIPENQAYDKLTEIISRLSKDYLSPNFKPHVTLLGQIKEEQEESIRKTKKLASRLKPFTIKLSELDCYDEYFKCLFLNVKKTEEIMESNLKARELFHNQESEYQPHLSLMYGNFTKIRFARPSIRREFNLEFSVRKIHLLSTQGQVKDWYKLREFSLESPNQVST